MEYTTEQEFWEYMGDMLDAAHRLLDETSGDLLLAVAIEAVTVLQTVTEADELIDSMGNTEYTEGMREGLSRAGLSLRALIQAYLARQDEGPMTIGELLNDRPDDTEQSV